jgi:hypothetical protein
MLPILCLINCTKQKNLESKFYYGDKVIVKSGFYKSFMGVVIEESFNYSTRCDIGYLVNLYDAPNTWVCHTELQLVRETK